MRETAFRQASLTAGMILRMATHHVQCRFHWRHQAESESQPDVCVGGIAVQCKLGPVSELGFSGNDSFVGSALADKLDGNGGNDILFGG